MPTLEATWELFACDRFRLDRESWDTRDGRIERPIIHHPGAVAILAQPTPTELLLVRQFRYPIRRWTLEIPAGTREPGEEAVATAARELREEAGYDCQRLVEMMRFLPAVGVSDEELILYRAEGLSISRAAPEIGELVSPEVVAIADLPRLLASGDICDAKTVIALAILGVTVVPVRVNPGPEA